MLTLLRTTSDHPDFITLVAQLDAILAELDGDEHAFYAQFNKTHTLRHVVVAFDKGEAVSCSAFKEYDQNTVEIKRMYTRESHRGKGLATTVLHELETWAKEEGYSRCVLETGKRQPEAIALYHKCGYSIIPNYGQYAEMENSVCFEKKLLMNRELEIMN
jgi:GNAT superfamily N-acetyltransferase